MSLTSEMSRKVDALHKLVTKMARMNTLNEVYTSSFDLLGNLDFSVSICIGVVEGDLLRLTCAKNVLDAVADLPRGGKGIMVRAWQTGATQVVNDTRLDPDFVTSRQINYLSEMAVPVWFDGNVVAVINIKDQRADAFTESDRQIVEILSEHMSSTMYRIRQSLELSESESRYRTLVENSNDAILVVSSSTIVYVNTVTAKLCGYDKPEEIIGKDALGFISQRYREQFRERIKSRLEGEPQPRRFDHEIVRKDGSIIQVETTASLINYGGNPAVLFVGRDLTERKRFESKLFALHKHAAQLGAAETMVEVSETTLSAITSVMGFKLANFLVKESDSLGCIDDVGFGSTYWSVPIEGEGNIPRAAREKKTVLDNDLSGDSDPYKSQHGIRSQLATPVVIQGEVEAVISVESTKKGAFIDSDVQILEIIAQHVASALERIGHS